MKRLALVIIVLGWCFVSSRLNAEEPKWNLIYQKSPANNDDKIFLVSTGGPRQLVAFGSEMQGSNTMPVLFYMINGHTVNKTQPPPSPNPWVPITMFYDIDMLNEQVGYASNGLGGVFKTTNGGGSWQQTGFDTSTSAASIQCFSEDVCYVINAQAFFKTTDGGATWQQFPIPSYNQDQTVGALFFLDENTGFLGGCTEIHEEDPYTQEERLVGLEDGFLLKTTDGGASWVPVFERQNFCVSEVFFLNESLGLVATWEYDADLDLHTAHVLRTEDGGATFDDLVSEEEGKIPPKGLNGTDFFMVAGMYLHESGEGWVVGDYGCPECGFGNTAVYFHTTDFAQTFTIVMDEIGANHTIYDVDFCGPNCGFAVGDMHMIFRLGEEPPQPDGDYDSDFDGSDGYDGTIPGDEEEVVPGGPGQPCYNPKDETLPQCNPTTGADTCLFNDSGSFCTWECDTVAECGSEYDSCCKEMIVDGKTVKYCVWDMNLCNSDETPEYQKVEGAKLGEPCHNPGVPGSETLPECGKVWGAQICLGLPDGTTFCSKECSSNDECPDSNCCAEVAPNKKYCIYGDQLIEQMCPDNFADGDAEQVELDTGNDNTSSNSGAASSGSSDEGCSGSTSGVAVLLMALVVAARFRNKERQK